MFRSYGTILYITLVNTKIVLVILLHHFICIFNDVLFIYFVIFPVIYFKQAAIKIMKRLSKINSTISTD